jgi:hypothetical protein
LPSRAGADLQFEIRDCHLPSSLSPLPFHVSVWDSTPPHHAPGRPSNNALGNRQKRRRASASDDLQSHQRYQQRCPPNNAAPGPNQTNAPRPNRTPCLPSPPCRPVCRALPRPHRRPCVHNGHHPPPNGRPSNRLRRHLPTCRRIARRRRRQGVTKGPAGREEARGRRAKCRCCTFSSLYSSRSLPPSKRHLPFD